MITTENIIKNFSMLNESVINKDIINKTLVKLTLSQANQRIEKLEAILQKNSIAFIELVAPHGILPKYSARMLYACRNSKIMQDNECERQFLEDLESVGEICLKPNSTLQVTAKTTEHGIKVLKFFEQKATINASEKRAIDKEIKRQQICINAESQIKILKKAKRDFLKLINSPTSVKLNSEETESVFEK